MRSFHQDGRLPAAGEIFVFGSNLAGRHGKGAAKIARGYGAVYGIAEGRMGRTYAIPTKDGRIHTLPLARIGPYCAEFINYAALHPETRFFMTRVGCGLACYRDADMAPLFKGAGDNFCFPDEWRELL